MKSPEVFLQHILTEVEFLAELSGNLTYDEFTENRVYTNAIVRSLEIIGEAAKNIPDEFRGKHPEIPWRGMTGLRDRLIHKYFAVDTVYVWEIITKEIPSLHQQIAALLENSSD